MCNLLLDTVRARGEVALAVASTGVAALLMEGGTTAHSRFKIPIHGDDNSYCMIPAQSAIADLIRRAKIVLWDEAPL